MLSAALLVASLGSSCANFTMVKIFECPDVPDEVIDDFGPAALTWYMYELDPWCEKLAAAAQAADAGWDLID